MYYPNPFCWSLLSHLFLQLLGVFTADDYRFISFHELTSAHGSCLTQDYVSCKEQPVSNEWPIRDISASSIVSIRMTPKGNPAPEHPWNWLRSLWQLYQRSVSVSAQSRFFYTLRVVPKCTSKKTSWIRIVTSDFPSGKYYEIGHDFHSNSLLVPCLFNTYLKFTIFFAMFTVTTLIQATILS